MKRYRKRSERPSCKTHPSDGGANHGAFKTLGELPDGTERLECSDCGQVIHRGPQGQLSMETWIQ